MLKSSVVLLCFNLNLQLFDFIMEETDNSNFHDSSISGPAGTLIYGSEYTKTILTNIRKIGHNFENRILGNWELANLETLKLGKGWLQQLTLIFVFGEIKTFVVNDGKKRETNMVEPQ